MELNNLTKKLKSFYNNYFIELEETEDSIDEMTNSNGVYFHNERNK